MNNEKAEHKFPPKIRIPKEAYEDLMGYQNGGYYIWPEGTAQFKAVEGLHNWATFISVDEHEAILREERARAIRFWVTPCIAFGDKTPVELIKEGAEPEFIIGTFNRMFGLERENG